MPTLKGKHAQFTYAAEGAGFPLILIPDDLGTMADWSPQTPLLGELCQVIVYEYGDTFPPRSISDLDDLRVRYLVSLLDALAIGRAYLAGYAKGGLTALHFARRYPERSEGLLLIGIEDDLTALPLHEIAMPTCAFAGAASAAQLACATRLASHLPRCAKRLIPDTCALPHREQPLPLGHAMMDFLIQCERQRNLVRGASFLL